MITVSNNEPKASLWFIDSKIKDIVDGKCLLGIKIENNGDLYCLLKANTDFYDGTDDMKSSLFKSQLLSLLPSNFKSFDIGVTSIPIGYYKVIVLEDYSNGNLFGFNLI